MREILFRGKRIDNGEWLEGNIIINHDFVAIMSYSGCQYWHDIIKVNSSTVGQFTGLTDKNGKLIFEGDILDTTNSNSRIWYVDYKKTAFCCNQGNANYSCELDDFMRYSDVEVIGNIHDNPELLEVSGDE